MNLKKPTYEELEKLLDQAEQEITKLKDNTRFKTLAEDNPDVIIWLSSDLRFMYINPAIETITGIPPDKFIGKTNEELEMPEELCKIWNNAFKMAMDTGNIQETEFEFHGIHGARTYNSRILPEFNEKGTLESLLSISRDITEEKKIRTELEFVASFPKENPYPVLRIDNNGSLLFSNESSRILLDSWDYGKAKNLPEDIREYAKNALAQAGNIEKEISIGVKHFFTTFAPITKGEYVNVYVIDITNRKQAEEELILAKNELEEKVRSRTVQLRAMAIELTNAENKERKRLAGILHNNLQQLLVSAKWTIQRLQKKEKIKAKQESLTRTAELLDEAITSSKSLVTELSPPVLYDSGLIPALKWLGRWMQEKCELTLNIDSEIKIPPDQEAICITLFQSVRELLFNVVKHSQVKEADILVKKKDKNIEVTVSDRGIGFDPAGMRDTYDFMSGFGLLSIRERLDFMGGDISVDSTKNLGTRISMTLPLPEQTGEKETAGITVPQASVNNFKNNANSNNNKIRVLVAEDHKIMREWLCGMLGSIPDIEIAGEASNGMDALEMALNIHPDIVIMDINMPLLNGIEATRRIRSETSDIKVIGLSMIEEEESANAMLKAGAVDYLHKDGPVQELIRSIRIHGLKPV